MRSFFHFILAYADDVLLMARSAGDLQALLHLINISAVKLGLKFNPKKCYTMHYSNKPSARCHNTIFRIANGDIPALQDGEPAMFLGKPIGAFLPRYEVTIDLLKQRGLRILTSKLTPWQRIDCLKTCYFPSLQFLMHTDQLQKTAWSAIDDLLKPLLKKTLANIPPTSPMNIYIGRGKMGLLDFP